MPQIPPNALVPFQFSSGKTTAKLAIIGEAFGESETRVGMPFVGYSGQELTRILQDAGIRRGDCFLSNVFPFRPSPSNNDIKLLCGPKKDCGPDYRHSALAQGKYILPEFLPFLDRLRDELQLVRPNLVVALGGTACWALLGNSGITRARGVVAESTLIPELKVLPTFHPASVLRNWAQRPIVVADLMKAKIEMAFPEIRRIDRQLLINPTLLELQEWFLDISSNSMLACDIETARGEITMISFASSATCGVVVPFVRRDGSSYWPSTADELAAWRFAKMVLESDFPKIWQNGLYDLQYLTRMGIRPKNCLHDTMLLHHSIYPELPKSLGFLGSIYCNESAWKDLRLAKEEKKDA